MSALAAHAADSAAARAPGRAARHHPDAPLATSSTATAPGRGARLACACGGRCPRCQSSPAVGDAASAAEQRAEAAARRVAGDAVLRSRAGAPAQPSPEAAQDAAGVAQAAGRPLDARLRGAWQGRLGVDLGRVRVHTDARANVAAQRLGAHAFAFGHHVAFAAGRYAPERPAGRHLIAHELAHLAEPDAHTVLRRDRSDYTIAELEPGSAGETDSIFFESTGSVIPTSELPKIALLATPAGRALTLHGYDSEEASAGERAMVVDSRLNRVEQALRAAGHTGTIARRSHPDEGVGDLDYRRRRRVEVLPTPRGAAAAPSGVDPCGAPGSENASGRTLANCERRFTETFRTAREVVNRAEADIVTSPTAAANTLVGRFFSGVPRKDVDANVTSIAQQVRQLDVRHRCGSLCDGGCDRPAYNSGTGLGASGAMMTLCPDWVSAGRAFRVSVLIHEAAHANPRQPAEDIAYASTRLVTFLTPGDAVRNTDSYVLLMRLTHDPTSMRVGPASPDVVTGFGTTGVAPEQPQAERALAWLESWLNYGDFDTGTLYGTLAASLASTPPAWQTSGTSAFDVETMHLLADAFSPELTDPGPNASAPVGVPLERDKTRVAAVHDRFSQLYPVVNHSVITLRRAAAGSPGGWSRAAGFPHVGDTVELPGGFFVLSAAAQVRALFAMMVHAHTGITVGYEPKYVRALDLIHTHRGLGP